MLAVVGAAAGAVTGAVVGEAVAEAVVEAVAEVCCGGCCSVGVVDEAVVEAEFAVELIYFHDFVWFSCVSAKVFCLFHFQSKRFLLRVRCE